MRHNVAQNPVRLSYGRGESERLEVLEPVFTNPSHVLFAELDPHADIAVVVLGGGPALSTPKATITSSRATSSARSQCR
jgi:hypothetical protein